MNASRCPRRIDPPNQENSMQFKQLFAAGCAATAFFALPAQAQLTGEAARVATANEAFDAALSRRDRAAVEAAWVRDGTVVAAHPRSPAVIVGWEAVQKSWEGAFTSFPELSVTLARPEVRVAGDVAWVVGVEQVKGRTPAGEIVEFSAMTTNIYERRNGQWLMVHHQATPIPK
jgi:ketosteroid isomerase-like protein